MFSSFIRKQIAVAAVLGIGLASMANAEQGVSLSTGFTDFTTWTLLGSASASNTTPGNGFTYSDLMLTSPGSNDSVGAGFAPAALTLDLSASFFFDFHFFIAGTGLRGDGLTFVLATAPGVGGSAGGGSALGYQGLEHSVALAIDTFNFDGEPVSPSLQILQNGQTTPLAVTETGVGDVIRNVPYQSYASLAWNPSGNADSTGTLSGFLQVYTADGDPSQFQTFTVESFIDLSELSGSPVYYGFTGATGASSDGHFVTSAMAVPVPEPKSALLMLAGMSVMGWLLRRQQRR
jgi:hypothetical protein